MKSKAVYYTDKRNLLIGESIPVAPSAGKVRLHVGYCGVCGTDMHIFQGHMDQRVKMPLIIGHEVSGTVAELGTNVSGINVGDKVAVRPLYFGQPTAFDSGYAHIGKNLKFIGIDLPGGMQASWTVPAYTLHKLPASLSLQHGALIEPAAVACHDVRLGEVKAGETCVVIGGGPIGLLIALVAKSKGATVLLSEINDRRIALTQSLGITVVNPLKQDLAEAVRTCTAGVMADCVFEVSGSAPGVQAMTDLCRARGRIVMVAIHPQPKPVNLFKFFWSELRLIGARLYELQDFQEAIELAGNGKLSLDRLITQIRPIEEAQQVFEDIHAHPEGIKTLIQCNR